MSTRAKSILGLPAGHLPFWRLRYALPILIVSLVGCSTADPVLEDNYEGPRRPKTEPFRVKPMFEEVSTNSRTAKSGTVSTHAEPRDAVFRERPNIRVTRLNSTPTTAPRSDFPRTTPLRKLLDEALAELERFEGQPDAELALADRLQKYKVQKKIIGLHQWLPAELEPLYLDRLLRSLESPADPPSKSHALMVASFYHDIDREDLRDATLARISAAGPPASQVATTQPRFRIDQLHVCSKVRDFKDFTPVNRSLKGGKQRILYGEIIGLTNREHPQSGLFESSIKATMHFYQDGIEVRRQRLSAPTGDMHRSENPKENNFFAYPFMVPSGLEGSYRIVMRVQDVFADKESEGELSIRIRR